MQSLVTLLASLTREEVVALASHAGTTANYLQYQIATGKRTLTVELAAALEHASLQLHLETGGRTGLLARTELSPVCGACPYACPPPAVEEGS